MKLSLGVLQQHFADPLPDAQTLADLITAHTAEVEDVIDTRAWYDHVVVAQLRSVSPIKEGLTLGQFDCGDLGVKQIVFGAVHPLTVDGRYAVALAGAQLKTGVHINEKPVAGVPSQGMVVDCTELGWKSPALLQCDAQTPNGMPLNALPGFADHLIDIDNKSLTHRPDLLGHLGFCREVSAITGLPWQWPAPTVTPSDAAGIAVTIETKGCRRFMAACMTGVHNPKSTLETQARIEHLGTREISGLVDITNRSLLELGQPMHVFDAAQIVGGITVRDARAGETLLALDGEEYPLTEQDIVIADDEKVLSIAGVMGGLASGVTDATTAVVWECACFDAERVRRTSARLGLRSESSMRYEKTLAPEACARALDFALVAAQDLCGAAQICQITDVFPTPTPTKQIAYNTTRARAIMGTPMTNAAMAKTLTKIGFACDEQDENTLNVTVPWWRANKDVSLAEDLTEELVRLRGFDQIDSAMPPLRSVPHAPNVARQTEHAIRNILKHAGFAEVMHYSFQAHTQEDNAVHIKNPLSGNQAQMRTGLLHNMLADTESPLREQGTLALFELGRVFLTGEGGISEHSKIGIVSLGRDADASFFQVRNAVLSLFERLGVHAQLDQQGSAPAWAHPGKWAQVTASNACAGHVAVLHPKWAKGAYAELSLSAFLASENPRYERVSAYPAVRRDLSLLVSDRALESDIVRAMAAASDVIESVTCFDRFADATKLGAGNKSLSFRLTLRSTAGTLSDANIAQAMDAVTTAVKTHFDAHIR